METPAQWSFLDTVPPIPVMKRLSPLSMKGYLPLHDEFSNFIDEEMNVHISKDENHKFGLNNLQNKNVEYLKDFDSRTVFDA